MPAGDTRRGAGEGVGTRPVRSARRPESLSNFGAGGEVVPQLRRERAGSGTGLQQMAGRESLFPAQQYPAAELGTAENRLSVNSCS